MFKKLLVIFFLGLFFFSFTFAPTVKAYEPKGAPGPWYGQTFPQWYIKVFETGHDDEVFGERYTAAQVQWIFYSLPGHLITWAVGPEFGTCMLSSDVTNCLEGVVGNLQSMLDDWNLTFGNNDTGFNINDQNERYAREDGSFSVTKFFLNNEFSGTGYLLQKFSDIRIIPEANAQTQGFGYDKGGAAILALWTASRNVCYGLLAMATIVLAFMIMFRVKISPQVVITAQSAIPKIAIAILLITFSYAIAGLLIDLMYVVIGLLTTLIKSAGLIDSNYSTAKLFEDFVDDKNITLLCLHYLILWIGAAFATILSKSFLGGILALIFTVVVLVVVIINIFKLILLTIKTLAIILLLIVAAPFQILLGVVVPGQGIGPWMKTFIGNLAVYPTVCLLFFMSFFFLAQAFQWGNQGGAGGWNWFNTKLISFLWPFGIVGISNNSGLWDPPLSIGGGTVGVRLIWMMVSYAIFAMIPKAAYAVKDMIEHNRMDYGSSIGASVGGAAGLGAGLGQAYAQNKQKYWESEAARYHGVNPAAEANALRKMGKWKATDTVLGTGRKITGT